MDTIKQKTITVECEGRKVIVRRMKWKAARAFMKKLAAHLGAVGTDFSDVLTKLPDLITRVEELADDIVVNSSDLTAEAFADLDVVEAAEVLAAAIKLNLGDELKNSFAGIVEVVSGLMSKKTNSTANFTPTSSTPAIPQGI